MRASGASGALRVGYQWAADLGVWNMAPDRSFPNAYVLRSTITTEHDYWITQEPIDLALSLGSTEWLWRGVEVRRSGDAITIVLSAAPLIQGGKR